MNNERPYVICHMMESIDGKIASGIPDKEVLMDFFDVYTQIEHELGGKVYMFGRRTMSAFAEAESTSLPPSDRQIDTQDFISDNSGEMFAITVDTNGVLRWSNNFIKLADQEGQFHIVTIVTEQTSKKYLAYLQEKNISYIFGGKEEIDFNKALVKLKNVFKIGKVLLEGGGALNGSMLTADAIDEISLLLLPRAINKKSAPSLFDYETKDVTPKEFELSGTKQLDNGVLWLRYRRK